MDKLKLNIKFEEDLSFQHPDFTKVIVWIATYGENANGSNITREAAKSQGQEHISCDPWIAEWGNPTEVIPLFQYLNKIGQESHTG